MDIKVPEPVKSARHASTDCNEAVAGWRAKAIAATKAGEEAAAPTVAKFEEATAASAATEAAAKAEIKDEAAAKAEEKAASTGIWTVTRKHIKTNGKVSGQEKINRFCGHGSDKFHIEMKETAFCQGDDSRKGEVAPEKYQSSGNKGGFLVNQDGDKVGQSSAWKCETQGETVIVQTSFHAEDCTPEVLDWAATQGNPGKKSGKGRNDEKKSGKGRKNE